MKFLELKNYYLLYLLIIIFFTVSFLQFDDYMSPALEIIIFLLIFVFGAISLYYYTQNEDNLHKVAFVIILLFGITCVFLTPIDDVSDELEHSIRSEIVSTGQISTDYIQIPNSTEHGYKTIASLTLLGNNTGSNVIKTDVDDSKIDLTPSYISSAFSQNPFYSYLPQAIGMLFAKLLDLNTIWLLWLGRLFNLIAYAFIISLAIRKTPILKFPMLIVSILPLAIYQAASLSADGMFISLSMLAFAYFLYLYKTPNIKWIDLGIFYGAIILSGLLKTPFLALSLLIFLVPKKNFENNAQNMIAKFAILITLAVGILWSGYATGVLANSWRGDHFIANHVNTKEQVNLLLSNPIFSIERFSNIFNEFPVIIDRLFYFSNASGAYSSNLLSYLYMIFFIIFALIYPLDEKFDIRTKLKGLLIGFLIYFGVIAVQYLTWARVGAETVMSGVFGRYFIPLLIFVPLILNSDIFEFDRKNLELISLTITLSFISGMIMLTVSVKY